MGVLLTDGLDLLLEAKRLEHDGVPFCLERVEEGRDRGRSGWARSSDIGA
jgi:hypothetical protein